MQKGMEVSDFGASNRNYLSCQVAREEQKQTSLSKAVVDAQSFDKLRTAAL